MRPEMIASRRTGKPTDVEAVDSLCFYIVQVLGKAPAEFFECLLGKLLHGSRLGKDHERVRKRAQRNERGEPCGVPAPCCQPLPPEFLLVYE